LFSRPVRFLLVVIVSRANTQRIEMMAQVSPRISLHFNGCLFGQWGSFWS
jgi:hypothetical protein